MRFMKQRKRRAGVATTEAALALPILFLFIFTGLEFARVNMIRNTLEIAAYEGARVGIVPGATATECRSEAMSLLNDLRIKGATVTVNPNPILEDSPTVSVTVSVPCNLDNGYVTPKFYLGKTLVATVSLPKEALF